jgi:ABC-2 type transport system permease protein
MSVTATTAPGEVLVPRAVSVPRGYRFELVKQLAQWRVRILIGLCWIGPAVTVVIASGQSALPADTLFGREMRATGWAGALVVLAFAGSWVFPLLVAIVAGDVFSFEDRLGTWRHLLVAVRSPRRIFIAKSLASLTVRTPNPRRRGRHRSDPRCRRGNGRLRLDGGLRRQPGRHAVQKRTPGLRRPDPQPDR